MKKLIMVALVSVIILTGVFSGCATAAKAFTEPNKIINTEVNEEFTIALGSNPTTGYSWQVAYDEKALSLVDNTYKEQDNTGKQIVGAGGTEYFTFLALGKGETQVTFTYQRPWEQPSAQDQTAVFTINIK
jgi:inhibitor of cysteine peptidase